MEIYEDSLTHIEIIELKAWAAADKVYASAPLGQKAVMVKLAMAQALFPSYEEARQADNWDMVQHLGNEYIADRQRQAALAAQFPELV